MSASPEAGLFPMTTRLPRWRLSLVLFSICLLAGAQAAEFDEHPVPVKAVAPEYPHDMKRENVSGIVTLKLVIDEHGDVLEKSVTKSTRVEFEAPALAAVSQWKFKPARKGGAAVRATITLPIKFTAES
jgi:TonB family C-terminal domain